MFDEPSLGLAPNIVEQVFAIIGSIRKSVTTVPMVEQNGLFRASDVRLCLSARDRLGCSVRLGKKLIGDEHVRSGYLGG